jgi:hypothetical protein
LFASSKTLDGDWRYGAVVWHLKHAGNHLDMKLTSAGGNGWSYSANADGKEYPVTGLGPGVMVKLLNVSATGFEAVLLRNGKEMTRNKAVITGEGYSLTTETFAQGSSTRVIMQR